MELAIALAVGAIIGSIITGIAKTSINDIPCGHWDYELKSGKLSALETRLYVLERENERLSFIYRSMEDKKRCFHEQYVAHCNWCHKTFYSKDMKDQEVADKLKSITISAEEIAKKLDIKII